MNNQKVYFKEYYKQNKEKILFRVKSNYAKNKLSIKKDQQTEQQNENIIKVSGPTILYFDN